MVFRLQPDLGWPCCAARHAPYDMDAATIGLYTGLQHVVSAPRGIPITIHRRLAPGSAVREVTVFQCDCTPLAVIAMPKVLDDFHMDVD